VTVYRTSAFYTVSRRLLCISLPCRHKVDKVQLQTTGKRRQTILKSGVYPEGEAEESGRGPHEISELGAMSRGTGGHTDD
jgi:hypothetical protein